MLNYESQGSNQISFLGGGGMFNVYIFMEFLFCFISLDTGGFIKMIPPVYLFLFNLFNAQRLFSIIFYSIII